MAELLEIQLFNDHIQDCNQRYQRVINRIDSIDTRLSRMEQLLLDIKYSLRPQDRKSDQKFLL